MLNVPTVIRPLPSEGPPPGLEGSYERVVSRMDKIGQDFPAVVRDISVNGAFIAGEPLPLLTRVSFSFPLEGYGQIEALGWSLWRREQDYEVPDPNSTPLILPRGFGVLFEAIPLDARIAIHKFVNGGR
ncbi:MAG TPA: PilZ domain-containing protein [Haliangium sp.]|nr:PilZ domain-containing protein [Haliangium sp.]